MGLEVSRGTRKLTDTKLTDRAFMREVGLLARERVVRRTLSGQDQHGQPFAPYSASYGAVKAKELGVGPVNLQVSGRMLQGLIIVDITDNSVTLGFSS